MSIWTETTLSEVATLQRGYDLPATIRGNGAVPVVGSFGVTGRHDVAKYSGPGVTIGRSGASIGVASYIDGAFWPLNTALFVKDFKGNDPRWVYYLLDSIDFTAYNSGSAQPSLNRNYLALIDVNLPPHAEQRAIAATLGALDDKIESNRRAIALIDELVRARFETDFELEQVADGVSIADLATVNARRKLTRGVEATYLGMSSLPEFSPVVLDWETRDFGSGQKFMNGDVLMARITPCLENGKTAVVDMLEDGEIGWGSTEYVVLSPKDEISTPWIYALVRHELIREWAIRQMTGTSGRQRFQADDFRSYRIAEPDPALLSGFNAFSTPLFGRVAQLRDETRCLTGLRDAFLPELLSGRVRVPVMEVSS